jgi:hypothetical protein
MVDAATATANLAAAEQAYHDIMTTGGVARLRHGDKWTEFSKANVALLAGYIRDLKGQLGLPGARPRGRRVAF